MPAAGGGRQPAQLVRLRVPRQPRRGEPAAGPGGLALDLPLAPPVSLGRHVAPHGGEDLLFFVGDVFLEHVAQVADRCAQSSGRARFRAEAGHGLGDPAERRVDRLMVVGQRGQVHGLPGGGGDHRPDDVVLAVLVGEDLGHERSGVAADGAGLGGRPVLGGDLAEAGGEPPQVLANRPVDYHDGGEVRLRLLRGSGPEREWRCGAHVPSLGRRAGG